MDTAAPICLLCGYPAEITDVDRGNRRYVACSNASCGDYEISRRAAQALAANPDRKRLLREVVARANAEGRVLEIFVDAAGNFDTTSVKVR